LSISTRGPRDSKVHNSNCHSLTRVCTKIICCFWILFSNSGPRDLYLRAHKSDWTFLERAFIRITILLLSFSPTSEPKDLRAHTSSWLSLTRTLTSITFVFIFFFSYKWAKGFKGAQVKVAIFDTGIDKVEILKSQLANSIYHIK